MKRAAKRFSYIAAVVFSAVVFVFASACGNEADNGKPPTEIDTELNLDNAYENDRPDYDGMFDYAG